IGPCPMMNVAQLVFDGRPIWFQSLNSTSQVDEIYDYIEAMLAADRYLPPPAQLCPYVFDYYRWNHTHEVPGLPSALAQADGRAAAADGILLLSHADTDLGSLERALPDLPEGFGPVRAYSLLRVTSDEQMESLLAAQAGNAAVLIARLHG